MIEHTRIATLRSRPGHPSATAPAGEWPLCLHGVRDGFLYVPHEAASQPPAPLAVLLHGAGGTAATMRFAMPLADELGITLLVPESRGRSWDVIDGDYGPDVRFIDATLALAFERCAIDPRRVGIGGFSDGASYALSLGLANGDLFHQILAWSPGFEAAPVRRGRPAVFVSHGTADEVLPIQRTSRRLVPALQREGYDVTYREFDGGHAVPLASAREALARL